MIKRLKRKFILLSTVSLFVLLAIIVVGMNLINYGTFLSESDAILDLLSENRGGFPQLDGEGGHRLPPHLSPELPYESRYFSVILNGEGAVIATDTGRIAAVSSAAAAEYALSAYATESSHGFIDDYRFVRTGESKAVRITFLDCGRKIDMLRDFMLSSALIALVGFAAVAVALTVLAERIVRPIAESYEKQKRFITDAGHEIKTPLTIIRANADLLELELGENESVLDIQKQTVRLAGLTGDLVELARMEEEGSRAANVEIDLSKTVGELVGCFRAPMAARSITFHTSIEDGVMVMGDPASIERLASILLDNACKYSNVGGSASLSLSRQGRGALFTVFNTTAEPIEKESLERLFDRFYRRDASRNSATGGHGIGLSLAKAIVTSHGGKISASYDDGRGFGISVIL